MVTCSVGDVSIRTIDNDGRAPSTATSIIMDETADKLQDYLGRCHPGLEFSETKYPEMPHKFRVLKSPFVRFLVGMFELVADAFADPADRAFGSAKHLADLLSGVSLQT